MKRQIIEINEEKCIGCGSCAGACHQGAIQIIDGKAKLVSDSYCDGLGRCLPKCPVNAIALVEKEVVSFTANSSDYANKTAQQEEYQLTSHTAEPSLFQMSSGGCPGSQAKQLKSKSVECLPDVQNIHSELQQWPVQLRLINPSAPYLANADVLIAADCTAFSYGNFHRDFMKNKVTVIACPKLDDNQLNIEKLTQIFTLSAVKSITVVRMQVPCCSGIVYAVKEAMLNAHCIVPYQEVIISTEGAVIC